MVLQKKPNNLYTYRNTLHNIYISFPFNNKSLFCIHTKRETQINHFSEEAFTELGARHESSPSQEREASIAWHSLLFFLRLFGYLTFSNVQITCSLLRNYFYGFALK